MTLVTIITIVKDCHRHLTGAMQSVFTQTYPHIEYIVIDGGSTDGTREIIESFSDRLAYWVSEADSGISEAVNKGITQAKGEFVAFLSGDNWFAPDAIEQLIKHAGSNTIVCHADFVLLDREEASGLLYSTDAVSLITRMSVCPEAMIFRLSALRALSGYNTAKRLASDHYLFLSCLKRYGISAFSKCPSVTTFFRRGGLSDRYFLAAYFEVAENCIELGESPIRAKVRLGWQIAKACIRMMLSKVFPIEGRSRGRVAVVKP